MVSSTELKQLDPIKKCSFNMLSLDCGQALTLIHEVRGTFNEEAIGFAKANFWHLKLSDREPGNKNQNWFYRYDCIVNEAWPNMALDATEPLLTVK